MNRKQKELKRREALAIKLYGSTKYNVIEKNHRRIVWLRRYLKVPNQPRRISVAELLLQRFGKS